MPSNSTRRALVIDSSLDFLDLLTLLLESECFAVATAATATEARVQLALSRPDLIITGDGLPGLSTASLRAVLAQDGKLCLTPVILCPAMPPRDDAAIDYPPVTVLPRPFDIDDLLSRANNLVHPSM